MGLFDFFKKKSYNSNSKLYKYDTLEDINSIPVPTEHFELNCDFTKSVEYVLQRKATDHKRAGNMDLAIACLKKSNEIMPYSPILYTEKDYLRLVKYLRLAKRFDEARVTEEKILGYSVNAKKGVDIQILQNAEIVTAELDNNPLILVQRGWRVCKNCAVYHDRIYSVGGCDARFPNSKVFEDYIASKACNCSLNSFPFTYGISIMRGAGEKNPIEYSNRAFLDDRTDNEIKEYNAYIQKQFEEDRNRKDYDWICERLPDIAPKSLSGYMRMKNSNSANYKNLIKKALELGYEIK